MSEVANNKKYVFVAGLPRSGSTILCNVLNQNPRFHATGTSPLPGVLNGVREYFWSQNETLAMPDDSVAQRHIENFIKGAFHGYYAHIEKEVIFDKSRVWAKTPEICEMLVAGKPRIIACVRDVRAILASFEKLWRKSKTFRVISQERASPVDFQTIEGRCTHLCLQGQILGAPISWLRDAVVRGFKPCIHFMEYEDFCAYPRDTMKAIYEFIEEEVFDHDFENITQTIVENDSVYQWGDLHKIKEGPLKRSETNWKTILPEKVADAYSNEKDFAFWKKV